jgi:mono/diheme cytochrome c family protein
MGARRAALASVAIGLALATALPSCRRARHAPAAARVDWDRAAFVLQLVGHEYREQTEAGDFSAVPALVAAIDGARAALPATTDARAQWLDRGLAQVREAVIRRDPGRSVARRCAALTAELATRGIPLAKPVTRPDLARGASQYQIACAPCHGPPQGPPPPSAARLRPPPTPPGESAATPYELFNRVTFGGAGTAMPSFAEALSASSRWDIAFFLFAEGWPPCASMRWPPLSAAVAAHTSDYDIWKAHGYGPAACLRRHFR